MGREYRLTCRECGYSYGVNMGVGFSFPLVYRETIKAGKKGEFGEEVKFFLEAYPDGVMDCEKVLLQCTSCRVLERGMDLSMYLPVGGPPEKQGNCSDPDSLEECPYLLPRALEEYLLVSRYDHICRNCGGRMNVINEDNLIVGEKDPGNRYAETCVRCPRCKGMMLVNEYLMWD